MSDYITEITHNHKSKGLIDEAVAVTIADDNLIKYNKYTLKISKIKSHDIDVKYYNARIKQSLRRNPSLYREIREFKQLFKFLNRLNIHSGYIQKTERPDFELSRFGRTYGIEITKIYCGNDWIAENVSNDIEAYKLSGEKLKTYMLQNKYSSRFNAISNNDKIKISAVKDAVFKDEEITQIKNKLFEKIRKEFDDYSKFDSNYIFAEVVYSGYKEISSYDKLNEEFKFFVSHLDVNFGQNEFCLVLKIGNVYTKFNLNEGTYTFI